MCIIINSLAANEKCNNRGGVVELRLIKASDFLATAPVVGAASGATRGQITSLTTPANIPANGVLGIKPDAPQQNSFETTSENGLHRATGTFIRRGLSTAAKAIADDAQNCCTWIALAKLGDGGFALYGGTIYDDNTFDTVPLRFEYDTTTGQTQNEPPTVTFRIFHEEGIAQNQAFQIISPAVWNATTTFLAPNF